MIKKKKRLKIYFRIDGKKYDTTVGYNKKRSFDEAMDEVNRIIQKEQEMYQNRITDDIIYK